MGMLDSLFRSSQPAMKATDEALLLHSMLLMCAADGVMEASELAALNAFIGTLPEFKGKNLNELFNQAKKLSTKFPSFRDSVKVLADIHSPAIKKKAFVLAVDIAMSSGDIDESEDQLLEAMQRILGVDDATASRIIEVMALKYAR
jgi:tellurite resistance protein